MWDDLLTAVGEVLLGFWPDTSKAEDYFAAEVLEIREKPRFSGRKRRTVRLRPLIRRPAGWYTCKSRHLPLFTPRRRVFVAVRKNQIIRVSELRQTDQLAIVNKSEKEIKP